MVKQNGTGKKLTVQWDRFQYRTKTSKDKVPKWLPGNDAEPKMCLRPRLSFCDTLTLKPICCLISVPAGADIHGDSCFHFFNTVLWWCIIKLICSLNNESAAKMDLLKTKEIGPEDWSNGARCSQSKEGIAQGSTASNIASVFAGATTNPFWWCRSLVFYWL